ncbi:Acid phosphatase type 7 [Tyrophagus putrescentiae]|nr:Acid phosphatase type 7 [Tyrophagus putrescentiae]
MKSLVFFFAFVFVLVAVSANKDPPHPVKFGAPEQVHISYGVGPSQMWVTWMSFEEKAHFAANATVQYGTKPHVLSLTATGTSTFFQNGNRTSFVHRVLLDNLKPSTEYFYRCGSEEFGFTPGFSFTTRPLDQEHWSPRILVFGDLGLSNGVSIPFIKEQVAKKQYDAILHVGDLAYNLDTNNGHVGDEYMRKMESAVANVPYQTVVGNHEVYRNFTHYTNRYTMIDEKTGENNNHFYSFNIGPVHVVAFSSEFYYWYSYSEQPIYTVTNTRIQYEWLEADLREANKPENRKKHPWIIAAGHRPMYCSTQDDDDCAYNESILRKGIPLVNQYGLEDLFYKYGVDIVFGAHEHTYERLFPVYDKKVYNGSVEEPYKNPKAPIHLLIGSAGCPELIDPFVSQPKPWSAKRISDYGVTEFEVLNKTHIYMRQRSTDKKGLIVDDAMFIKEKHGPEAWL